MFNLKKLLISLSLIACGLTMSPVKAHPPDEEYTLKILNIGRHMGRLESTCVMGIVGVVSAPRTELALSLNLKTEEKNIDRTYAKMLADNILKKFPKCLTYIPREYLID